MDIKAKNCAKQWLLLWKGKQITLLNGKKFELKKQNTNSLALKKLPVGVRPIGVGELMDRCADTTMLYVTEGDVKDACNSDQLCSGIKAGMEAAIHAIRELFQERCEDGFGLLLMDAANAFGSLSRSAALWNARVLWTRCSRFLFNSYRGVCTSNNQRYISYVVE